MVYAPVGVPWVDDAMRRVAKASGLQFGVDVVPLPGATPMVADPLWCEVSGDRYCELEGLAQRAAEWVQGDLTNLCGPCPLVHDNATLADLFLRFPNYTQHGVLFHSAYMTLLGGAQGHEVPPESGYTLFYPGAAQFWSALGDIFSLRREPPPTLAVAAKAAIDATLLSMRLDDDAVRLGKRNATTTTTSAAAATAAASEPVRVSIDVDLRDYPTTQSRFYGFDLTAFEGGVFFFLVPAASFLLLLLAAVREKEDGHAAHLRVLGVPAGQHLASWAAAAGVLPAVSAITLVLEAKLLVRLPVFVRSSTVLMIGLFWLAGVAMSAAALAMAAFLSSLKRAQTVGALTLLLGLVAQAVACSAGGMLLKLLYVDQVVPSILGVDLAAAVTHAIPMLRFARTLLTGLAPAFNFSRAFADIAASVASTVDFSGDRVVPAAPGAYFGWAQLWQPRQEVVLGLLLAPPPTGYALLALAGQTLLFWGVARLFWWRGDCNDGAAPAEEAGGKQFWQLCALASRRPHFLRFWSGWRRLAEEGEDVESNAAAAAATAAAADDKPPLAATAASLLHAKKEGAICPVCGPSPAPLGAPVWTRDLRKTYPSSPPGAQPAIPALNGASFSAESGQICALLGQNGAGKTTALNLLVGAGTGSGGFGGEAWVCGHDVRRHVAGVRCCVGYCPQSGVVYGRLSCREHLELYGELRGLCGAELQQEVDHALAEAALTAQQHKAAEALTGGMRRRLALASASLGRPPVMLLDEPTSGVDSYTRKELWSALRRQSGRGAAVLVTTHTLADAESGADALVFLAEGAVVAAGSVAQLSGGGWLVKATGRSPAAAEAAAARARAAAAMATEIAGVGREAADETVQLELPEAALSSAGGGGGAEVAAEFSLRGARSSGAVLGVAEIAALRELEACTAPDGDAPPLLASLAVSTLGIAGMLKEAAHSHPPSSKKLTAASGKHSEAERAAPSAAKQTKPFAPGNTPNTTTTSSSSSSAGSRWRAQFVAVARKSALTHWRRRSDLCLQMSAPALLVAAVVMAQRLVSGSVGGGATVLFPSIWSPLDVFTRWEHLDGCFALFEYSMGPSLSSVFAAAGDGSSSNATTSGTSPNTPQKLDFWAEIPRVNCVKPGAYRHYDVGRTFSRDTPSDVPLLLLAQAPPPEVSLALPPQTGGAYVVATALAATNKLKDASGQPLAVASCPGVAQLAADSRFLLLEPAAAATTVRVTSPGAPPALWSATFDRIAVYAPSGFTCEGYLATALQDPEGRPKVDLLVSLVESPEMRPATADAAREDALLVEHLKKLDAVPLDTAKYMNFDLPDSVIALKSIERLRSGSGGNGSNNDAMEGYSIRVGVQVNAHSPWEYFRPNGAVKHRFKGMESLGDMMWAEAGRLSALNLVTSAASGWLRLDQQLAARNATVGFGEGFLPTVAASALQAAQSSRALKAAATGSSSSSAAADKSSSSSLGHILEEAQAALTAITDWARRAAAANALATMPALVTPQAASVAGLAGGVVFPLALGLPFAPALAAAVAEVESGALPLMRCMGLSEGAHWAAVAFADFVVYLAGASVLWACGAFAGLDVFVGTAPSLTLAIIAIWGLFLSAVAVAAARRKWVQGRAAAAAVAYVTVVAGGIAADVVSSVVFGRLSRLSVAAPPPFWLLVLWPQLALARAFFLLGGACADGACYSCVFTMRPGDEMRSVLLALAMAAAAAVAVASGASIHVKKRCKSAGKQQENCNVHMLESESVENNVESGSEVVGRTTSGDWAVRLEGLVKTYGRQKPRQRQLRCCQLASGGGGTTVEALRGLTLRVAHGSFVGLLGRNGAGKTTALGCLCGEIVPDAGSVLLCGADVLSEQGALAASGLGVCRQRDVLWEALTAFEAVEFVVSIKLAAAGIVASAGDVRREAFRALKAVDLVQHAHKLPGELSGGMRRRLCLSLALAGPGSAPLALDEPCTGLDAVARASVLSVLAKEVSGGGRTALLSSHDVEEVEALCSHVAVVEGGRVWQEGTTASVVGRARGHRIQLRFERASAADPEEAGGVGSEHAPASNAAAALGAIAAACSGVTLLSADGSAAELHVAHVPDLSSRRAPFAGCTAAEGVCGLIPGGLVAKVALSQTLQALRDAAASGELRRLSSVSVRWCGLEDVLEEAAAEADGYRMSRTWAANNCANDGGRCKDGCALLGVEQGEMELMPCGVGPSGEATSAAVEGKGAAEEAPAPAY